MKDNLKHTPTTYTAFAFNFEAYPWKAVIIIALSWMLLPVAAPVAIIISKLRGKNVSVFKVSVSPKETE